MSNRKVKLGQEVFHLSTEGEVVRTMVSEIYTNGYQFLDESGSWCPHWFTFDKALVAAKFLLETKKAELRKQLRSLTSYGKFMGTRKYFNEVVSAFYEVYDRSVDPDNPRLLNTVTVPTGTHLKPGDKVYLAINPVSMTSPGYLIYRPHPYFILETAVTKVGFTPSGEIRYGFSTSFVVQKFYTSQQEAALADEFCLVGRGGQRVKNIPFVSIEEEKQGIAGKIDALF